MVQASAYKKTKKQNQAKRESMEFV